MNTMVIDHIGVVVRSIEKSIKYWEYVFEYKRMTEIVTNTRQKVKVVFLYKKDSIMVKLVEPVDETSPVHRFALKGGGLHHICFKCEDINQEIERLKENGLRVITKPEPGEAFEYKNIAFLFSKDGLNIELIDTDLKAKMLESKEAQA